MLHSVRGSLTVTPMPKFNTLPARRPLRARDLAGATRFVLVRQDGTVGMRVHYPSERIATLFAANGETPMPVKVIGRAGPFSDRLDSRSVARESA